MASHYVIMYHLASLGSTNVQALAKPLPDETKEIICTLSREAAANS